MKTRQILVVETDKSKPDVYKAHRPHENIDLGCKMFDLDDVGGGIELVHATNK